MLSGTVHLSKALLRLSLLWFAQLLWTSEFVKDSSTLWPPWLLKMLENLLYNLAIYALKFLQLAKRSHMLTWLPKTSSLKFCLLNLKVLQTITTLTHYTTQLPLILIKKIDLLSKLFNSQIFILISNTSQEHQMFALMLFAAEQSMEFLQMKASRQVL